VYRLLLLSCVTTNVCRVIGVARMRGQTLRCTLTVAMVLLKGSSTSMTAVSSKVVLFQLQQVSVRCAGMRQRACRTGRVLQPHPLFAVDVIVILLILFFADMLTKARGHFFCHPLMVPHLFCPCPILQPPYRWSARMPTCLPGNKSCAAASLC
jgi:hypothetical protein